MKFKKPITFLAFFLPTLLSACYSPAQPLGELTRDARAAVLAQGYTSVAIAGPAFNCARRGAPRMIGGKTDGWMTSRQGAFFTARVNETSTRYGDPVRGMVCVGRQADPSVMIFPQRPR